VTGAGRHDGWSSDYPPSAPPQRASSRGCAANWAQPRRSQQDQRPADTDTKIVSVRAGLVRCSHPGRPARPGRSAAAGHSASPEAAPLTSQVSQLAFSTLLTPGSASSARSSRCCSSSASGSSRKYSLAQIVICHSNPSSSSQAATSTPWRWLSSPGRRCRYSRISSCGGAAVALFRSCVVHASTHVAQSGTSGDLPCGRAARQHRGCW